VLRDPGPPLDERRRSIEEITIRLDELGRRTADPNVARLLGQAVGHLRLAAMSIAAAERVRLPDVGL
jgi:hypothetical protein